MDLIDWDEKMCKKKVKIITSYLVKVLKWPKENLYVVPISAFEGNGLMDTKGIPEWYKGKSFIDTLTDLGKDKNVKKTLTTPIIESDRVVCNIRYIGNADNIINSNDEVQSVPIMSGYMCNGHINGIETEIIIDKIKNKADKRRKFLRTGEEGLCIVQMKLKYPLQVGMKIILRKNEDTIGFGEITKLL